MEVLKHNGSGDGICPLCDTEEDSNHIFFSCASTQFLWSCFHEEMGGTWCHSNFPDLCEELRASSIGNRHIRWLGIGVLSWTLWTIRNKFVIEHSPLRRPTDAIYKICGYLQLWKPLSRVQELGTIDTITAGLMTIAHRLAPPLPSPPPEPD